LLAVRDQARLEPTTKLTNKLEDLECQVDAGGFTALLNRHDFCARGEELLA
jgi:hypothetical protein